MKVANSLPASRSGFITQTPCPKGDWWSNIPREVSLTPGRLGLSSAVTRLQEFVASLWTKPISPSLHTTPLSSLPCALGTIFGSLGSVLSKNPLPAMLGASLCVPGARGEKISAKPEKDLPNCPGVERMATTFYAPSFDPFSGQPFPIGAPVVKLTYNDDNTREFDGHACKVPDQFLFYPEPECFCSALSLFDANALNFSAAISSMATESSSSWFGAFTSSASQFMGQAISFAAKSQVALGMASCAMTTHFIKLLPYASSVIEPNPNFAQDVNTFIRSNPDYLNNIANYSTLFSIYGTHQPTLGTFGGMFAALWMQEMGAFQQMTSSQAASQIAGELMWSFAMQGGASGNASQASSFFLSSAYNQTYKTGGSWDPSSCNAITPAIVKMNADSIAPIAGLVETDPAKRPRLVQGVLDAIQNQSAIAMLNSVVPPMLNTYSALFSKFFVDPTCGYTFFELQCDGTYPQLSNCCQISSSAPIPDWSTVQKNNASVQETISSVLNQIQQATKSMWISQESLTGIIATFAMLTDLWSQGVSTATCSVNYQNGGGCPSVEPAQDLVFGPCVNCVGSSPLKCDYSMAGNCCVTYNGWEPSPCCSDQFYWDSGSLVGLWSNCPTQCPDSPSGPLNQMTCFWPTGLGS